MKKSRIVLIVALGLFAFILIGVVTSVVYFFSSLKPVDENDKENIPFEVKTGEATNTIIEHLEKDNLIKSALVLKIYAKMNPGTPQAGTYVLTKKMDAKEIYEAILNGDVTRDTTWITFVEGKRLTYIADVISKNFDYTSEEVLSKMDDRDFISGLIEKYDCLSNEILDDKIYHPLEGYLFPDTYEFLSDVTIEEIIESMLSNTESKLSSVESEIANSNLSLHEIMTLSSIVELEGARSDDRAGVSGVFYNRLKSGMTLGSDVTTYYAVGKNFDKDLTWSDLNSCNGYNTRGTCVDGLPVGPIANFSYDSLKATLEPRSHDYYFFVADKNGKTYFSKTSLEHEQVVQRLKNENLWFEY